MPAADQFERALIVEDQPRLQLALRTALKRWAKDIAVAGSVAEATEQLVAFKPQLILLDVQLPDGLGHTVAQAAQALAALPIIVAVSAAASPAESFALAELGVRRYLQKPIDPAQLDATIQAAIDDAPDLRVAARAAVGRRSIHDVEAEIREAMVEEALGQAQGSKRGAAKLLDVSRQLVQHMLRKIRG